MSSLKKFAILWKKSLELELSSDMAYRISFLVHCLGMVFFGLLGPLMAILIYSTTNGIPGWTFWEFILFQGTGTLVWGLGHFAMFSMVEKTLEDIRYGFFDRVLVRPFNPLLYITAAAIDLDGLAPATLGAVLIVLAGIKVGGITLAGIAGYAALILLALIFLYALIVLMTALAFLVVKSFGLFAILEITESYSQWPITVFTPAMAFTLSFVVPAGLAAFYPALALLGRIDLVMIAKLSVAAFVFLAVSLFLWTAAMKKYTSAGG